MPRNAGEEKLSRRNSGWGEVNEDTVGSDKEELVGREKGHED